MRNPADKALVDAFYAVAYQQRRARSNLLLEEFDRLERLDGAELVRNEPLEFRRGKDPEFERALKTAIVLVPNIDEVGIEYVAFRPVKSDAHKRSIFVVFEKDEHRPFGSEAVVSEAAWINAWTRVGS